MNKTDLGKFKEQLINLSNYISEIFSTDKDVEKLNIKLKLGIDSNPRLVAELFAEKLTPFARHILDGNDSYFLNNDLSKMVDSDNAFEQIEQKLKSLWTKLNEDQKERIRKYFKLLLVLSCLTTKNEQLRVLINLYREIPLEFQ